MGAGLIMSALEDLSDRILHLERKVAEMEVTSTEQRAKLRESIQRTTASVAEVKATADATKADTAEIVSLLKGVKVLVSSAKWIGGPSVLGGAVYAFGKLARWWD